MKKLLVLLLLVSGTAHAGAGDAFTKGFADALNRSMGGQPYQAPAQANQQAEVYQQAGVTYHYDAVINAANMRGNYYFFSYQECTRFLQRDRTYDECVRVAD